MTTIQGKSSNTGFPSVDKPWLKHYSEEVIKGKLPECSIYEYMYENNKNYPHDTAINYFGKRISYRRLFESIDKTASALQALGVKEGEIVTVALPSIPEALYIVYALNKIGAVANMIHPLAGENEIIHYLNEVESKVAFFFDGTYRIIKSSIGKTSVKKGIVVTVGDSLPTGLKLLYSLKARSVIVDDSISTWKRFLAKGKGITVSTGKKDSSKMAIISHTGGTTGEPKGVMLSDNNINAMIWQIGKLLSVVRQESQLAVLPPFVNYSLVNAMLEPIGLGNTSILIPDYKPKLFAQYAKKYKPTYISSIPAYWEAILKIKNIERADLSFLRCPFYGGEAMNPVNEEAVNQLLHKCGAPNGLAKGLGATELVSAATLTPYDFNTIGSVGIPLPKINCKLVLSNMEEASYGNTGEICFSGPTIMMGYYNKENDTNDIIKLHPDGQRWLHTGDLGYMDENGVLFVTGRVKRIFMTKGRDKQITKVFPDRIEKAICLNPNVELCCVVGIPDEERINYPKAFVVLKQKEPSDEIEKNIMDICKENLPEYMIPEEIEFRKDFPRTERGKVDYRALERMAKDK